MSVQTQDKSQRLSTDVPAESSAPAPVEVKSFRDNFTSQHIKMIAGKYTAKYSDEDQKLHNALWPEFIGDTFTKYVLAETLNEAKNAVFSKNKPDIISDVLDAMKNYTPTNHNAVLTDRQVRKNVDVQEELLEVAATLETPAQREAILKDVRKSVKLGVDNGKDTELVKAKFWYACGIFGIVPQTIW